MKYRGIGRFKRIQVCLTSIIDFVIVPILAAGIATIGIVSYIKFPEFPGIVKGVLGVLTSVSLLRLALTQYYGLCFWKNGSVTFVPDIRVRNASLDELQKVVVVFTEWNNKKYDATVRLIYKDGSVFEKDYMKNFRDYPKYQWIGILNFTIKKQRVDKICEQLEAFDYCQVSVVDFNKNIIYQNTTD